MLQYGPEAAKRVRSDGIFKSELAICREVIAVLLDGGAPDVAAPANRAMCVFTRERQPDRSQRRHFS